MVFKEIKLKNFISYGNKITSFKFDSSSVITILGKNFQGKSTILEAIYFVLTGKPLRNINKTKLINTINKKECYVELIFDIDGSEYIVKRGIKPNIFEIYKDDNLINEESHVKDYQLVLENITGLSSKVIEQILIISNRFYKPFLELTAAEKRSFTETIFGTDVLSDLNDKLKLRLNLIKEKEPLLEKDIERINSNVDLLTNADKLINISELELLIENNSQLIINKEISINELRQELLVMTEKKAKIEKKTNEFSNLISKKCKCELELSKPELCEVCPTCKQSLPLDVINNNKEKYEKEKSLWSDRLNKIQSKLIEIEKYKESLITVNDKLNEIKIQLNKLELEVGSIKTEIEKNKKTINLQKKIDKDNQSKIDKLLKQKDKSIEQLNDIKKNKQAIVLLQKLISEKGLRKYIFSKYITLLNSKVNEKLSVLGVSYQIKIDEEFKDELISNNYKGLESGSLSSGEKQRLDLSIMFAFLDIAKMRNDVNCNLLCFDEMFGDIDNEGLQGIDNIFNQLKRENKSILLITHDDRIKELSDVSYVIKKNKFSSIEKEHKHDIS